MIFGEHVWHSGWCVMWLDLLMTSAISCPLGISVENGYGTECGMFVM